MNKDVIEYLGNRGRLLGGSKGRLQWNNPDNVFIFNGNVCTEKEKLWYGDLNLSSKEDLDNLKAVAKKLGEDIYVLSELRARFDNEQNFCVGNHIIKVTPYAQVVINESYIEENEDGQLVLIEAHRVNNSIDIEKLSIPGYISEKVEILNVTGRVEFPSDQELIDGEQLPLMAMYEHLKKSLNIDIEKINVDEVCISVNTAKKINLLTLQRLTTELDDYAVQKEFSMLDFIYGPRVSDKDFIEDGYIYLLGAVNESSN